MVNGESSLPAPVIFGVPQGSVLRPLLFLIYINEINLGDGAKITLYAYDVLLFRVINFPEDFARLQNDIDKVGNWSSINFLTLNRDKCKYTIVSRGKLYLLHLHHFCLKAFLWNGWKCSVVLLSHDLSWGGHVQSICRPLAFSTEDSTTTLPVNYSTSTLHLPC